MSLFQVVVTMVLAVFGQALVVPQQQLLRGVVQRQQQLHRQTPVAFFGNFLPNKEAEAKLDTFVGSAKAVLLTDGSKVSEDVKVALKKAKVGNWKEIRLDQEPDKNALVSALKRRVGTAPPTLIVGGAVFDKKRMDYLIKQDMMLAFFRQAGTSGEVRLPFQDLRYYLSKTTQ